MKQILTAMLCIVGMVNVFACDVCGGVGSMSGIGFLPNSDFHFIGLTYRTRTYTTEHPKLFASEATVTGNNTFQTAELFGRYAATDRIQLLAFLPVHSKNITDTEKTYRISGVGDASLMANYVLVKKSNLRWLLGSGVKFPTGEYSKKVNEQLIPNLQSGTGSYDVLFTSNFTCLKNNFGLNMETNYSLTSANKFDYKYGNQLDATFTTFYKYKKGKQMFVPQISLNYAQTAKDVIDVDQNLLEKYSGASLLSLPLGLDIYRGNLVLRLNYKIPLRANLSEGYVIPKVNCQAQILYIINKK
ncbi:MAG: hypothetical protein COA58_02585 [Bacteroidetes bacterium]|nr:MAG: hypothetical protein COA58_02585 [Bacteroidota bacterium]